MRDLRVVEAETSTRPDLIWAGDRIAEGHTVATGYVPIHDVVIYAPHGHNLYPAEVERAYRRQLEIAPDQGWPPPTGYWRSDGRFVLTDGRNRYVASLMLGLAYIFVAWLVAPDDASSR